MATEAHRRYKEIMQDIEELVKDHIQCDNAGTPERSKLRFLVPSVGRFFTPLSLVKAFEIQDEKRAISSRRFVAPSFNDIRVSPLLPFGVLCIARAHPGSLLESLLLCLLCIPAIRWMVA